MENKLNIELIMHLRNVTNCKIIKFNGIEVYNLLDSSSVDIDYGDLLMEVEKLEKFNYYPRMEKVTINYNNPKGIILDVYFSMQQIKTMIFVGEISH